MKTNKRYKSRQGTSTFIVLMMARLFACGTSALGQSGNEPYFALENYSDKARITYEDGNPVAPGVHAQLYIGRLGERPETFQSVFPSTITTSREGFEGYLEPKLVYLPSGFFGGQFVTVQLRAFDGDIWESSMLRGESITLDLKLLDQVHGPNRLTGLEPFSLYSVPEPNEVALLIVGVSALFWGGHSFNLRGNRI